MLQMGGNTISQDSFGKRSVAKYSTSIQYPTHGRVEMM